MMGSCVNFIDTSVLCNLLPVPGRDQDREEVLVTVRRKIADRETMILPVTTVIKVGNHIRHIPDGRVRRATAVKFTAMLELVLKGKAPWILHEFSWGSDLLRAMLEGAGTGVTFVDHATRGLGGGDLCLLAERDMYIARSGITRVTVWTLDNALLGFS